MRRHHLIGILEIAVVIGDMNGHAAGDRRIDFFRRLSPLFHRVVFEDMFVDVFRQLVNFRIGIGAELQDRHLLFHPIFIDQQCF